MGTIIAILLAVLGLFAQTAGNPATCKRRGCNEPRRGSQFCVGHECPVQSCSNAPQRGEPLCGPHLRQAEKAWTEGGDYTVSRPNPEPTPTGKWPGLFLIGGTGSRSLRTAPVTEQKAVWAWLLNTLTALKAVHGDGLRVVSGLAEGFDEALAKAALELGIPVIAMLPNAGYGRYYWGRNSLLGRDRMDEFEELLSRCNQVVYSDRLFGIKGRGLYYDPRTRQASFTKGPGLVHSNLVRNQLIVNWSDLLLVYRPESSGTADCVTRAKKAGLGMKVFSRS